MKRTLLTRIGNLEQYDALKKTVIWIDPKESRWAKVYGQLEIDDHIIFITTGKSMEDKLLIGNITKINNGQSLECSNIQEINCTNDQFLQLHEIYPELISRVKASFSPFIHPIEINIQQLIADAEAKKFVSFYIFDGKEKYSQLLPTLRANDRVVFIDDEKKFENVKLFSPSQLVNFPAPLEVNISVIGLNLDEVRDKNEKIKRKSASSNNVNRILNIEKALTEHKYYKFQTFFSYYDCLFNKRVYRDTNGINPPIISIPLRSGEKVFKVSMSGKPGEIKEDAFDYFMEKELIVVYKDTKAKGVSTQTQGEIFAKQMKDGDYFYLCRGNNSIELIGRILSDAEPCEYQNLGAEGWIQRQYETIVESISRKTYSDDNKWWTPNNNSTCISIPDHEMDLANSKLFIPFFNAQFLNGNDSFSLINENIEEAMETSNRPLNQILYGPPGTGKTYHTINKAIAIINPKFDLNQPREFIKEEYDRLVKAGQIVFTTFHQSMSYEDFIEGIKPLEPQSDDQFVKYKIQNGIFKKACALAAFNCYEALNAAKDDSVKYSFDDLYEAYIGSIQEQLKQQKPPIYQSFRGREVEVKAVNSNHSIIARAKNSVAPSSAPLTKENLQKLYDRFKTIDQIKDLGEVRETVQILPRITEFYAVFKGLKEFEKNFEPDEQLILEAKEVGGLNIEEIEKNFEAGVYRQAMRECGEGNKTVSPVVVIIDEINRGNVSQIFGELITLIEEDKRMGKLESLEVMLTYSKKMFGVPLNLYIIGTMNTADRSVEALDTALRRRFSFEEMPPRPELVYPGRKIWELWWEYPTTKWEDEPYYSLEVKLYNLFGIKKDSVQDHSAWEKMEEEGRSEGQITYFKEMYEFKIDLQVLLTTINQRIEKLLDRDHQIGHSYFMSVASLDDLKVAFQNKIIPLLQEYFFGDYGKIGLVLGKGFVRKKERDKNHNSFADFDHESSSDFESRDLFELVDYTNEDLNYDIKIEGKLITMDFNKAIKLLMKQDIE